MTNWTRPVRLSFVFALLAALVACSGDDSAAGEWPAYGGDAGGSGYSGLDQINRETVDGLEVAWIFQTGDAELISSFKFEATPIQTGGLLYVSTPLNRVIAIDPETGVEVWRYDPDLDRTKPRNQGFVSRGVSYWEDPDAPASQKCGSRIFQGTIDATLIALDARTGELCEGFGEGGVIPLDRGVGPVISGFYSITSPPSIIGDVIVIGSSIRDHFRVEEAYGTVRGFDARTGEQLWDWDPIPRNPDQPGWDTWTPEAAQKTGAANAWAPISADPELGLVFVPTGSASPDFYGGERPGANLYSSSVVALHAATGEIAWHFQVVHHDIFDYDVSSQPTLVTVPRDGVDIPAVAVVTKMAHVFILDRATGEPLFPVEERPVPQSDVEGEESWPTQPFPVLPPPLLPEKIGPEDAWGITVGDEIQCRAQIESARNEGIFTPPSLQGTLFFPSWWGAINWGGAAFDKERSILVTGVKRLPGILKLIPRESATSGNQLGTPYEKEETFLFSPGGLPCIKPPWSNLVAIDLASGEIMWETPLGEVPADRILPSQKVLGTLFFGGPITTAGGLVFMAATLDDAIRAFDIETGEEVWKRPLPAGGQATPMTYEINGRQYVVIVAGGHNGLGSTPGDYVVAFALP